MVQFLPSRTRVRALPTGFPEDAKLKYRSSAPAMTILAAVVACTLRMDDELAPPPRVVPAGIVADFTAGLGIGARRTGTALPLPPYMWRGKSVEHQRTISWENCMGVAQSNAAATIHRARTDPRNKIAARDGDGPAGEERATRKTGKTLRADGQTNNTRSCETAAVPRYSHVHWSALPPAVSSACSPQVQALVA